MSDDLAAWLLEQIAEDERTASTWETNQVPLGMHTCQSARADGASWIYFDEYWQCPFCKARGDGWRDEPQV